MTIMCPSTIFLGVSIIILLLLYMAFPYQWKSWRMIKLVNRIPGPKGIPYFGIIMELKNLPHEEFLNLLTSYFEKYGSTFKIWVLGIPEIFISDLDDIETVLSSRQHITKALDYTFLEPWLGKGLLTSTGDKWQQRRKILTPAFHFKILEEYLKVFNKNAALLNNHLRCMLEQPSVDVSSLVTLLSLDIVCETAMGTSVNALRGQKAEYVNAVKGMSRLVQHRQFNCWLWSGLSFWASPSGRQQQKLLSILHGFTDKVIKERRAEYKALKIKKDINNRKKRLSFLDLLIEVSEEDGILTDKDIREEVDTVMFEGHDTTASALSWALFLLGHHPQIQERAVDELREIFGHEYHPLTYDDLHKMRYLEQIIKETLRLYPSVPIFSRLAEEDLKLKKFTIPAGALVPITPYFIHRNPEIFPDPETFNPDNFSPANVEGRHPFAYLPFSAGPRNCIGQRFAMIEAKTILSSILCNFKLESLQEPKEVNVLAELILRPKENLRLKFTPRTLT